MKWYFVVSTSDSGEINSGTNKVNDTEKSEKVGEGVANMVLNEVVDTVEVSEILREIPNTVKNQVENIVKGDEKIREKVLPFLSDPNLEKIVYQQNKDGDTFLHLLVAWGEEFKDEVLQIIKATSDGDLLNIVNSDGYSILHCAALARTPTIIEALMRKGANPCLKSKFGDTPLHLACMNNDVRSAQILLFREWAENMVDHTPVFKYATLNEVDFYNDKGKTCLHIAVSHNNQELVHELLLHGADVEAKTKMHGYTALRIAMEEKFSTLAWFLTEKWNASMDNATDATPDDDFMKIPTNPFHRAEFFFKQDEDGDTQLHIAAVRNEIEYVSEIIDSAPDSSSLDLANIYGDSALHLAARVGANEVCELLIKKGADPCLRNYTGDTPLHLACIDNNISCAQALMYRVMPYEENNHAGLIELPKLDELLIHNYKGETCLHLAVAQDNIELVNSLLLHGADIEEKRHADGYKALHIAVAGKLYDMVKFLAKKWKAYIHAETYGGKTAYQLAERNGDHRMTKLLLKFGAEKELYSDGESYSEDDY